MTNGLEPGLEQPDWWLDALATAIAFVGSNARAS